MSRFDTLPAWLSWLETLHPKAIDMGLERVRVVADRLGVRAPGMSKPKEARKKVPVVTVAGTNGKGSTTAVLEALLIAHGKHVGCYTSPHILRFNERIRIDGRDVDDAAIVQALARVDAARGDISLTYFEFTTLAAFVLFSDANLDVWVLEVGLGGRLDAVNVIDADVAVLTSVGIDHQEWLGNTREAIGAEKSGIFRAGRPAVIGDVDPPESVHTALAACSANGFFAGKEFHYAVDSAARSAQEPNWSWHGCDRQGLVVEWRQLPQPHLALANAATALQAFVLLPFVCDVDAVRKALASVNLPGRNQRVVAAGRMVIADVGHNADALLFLRQELVRHYCSERFHIVLGMLADKDIAAAVRVLEPLGQSWHIAPLPSPRSATVAQLKMALESTGIREVNPYESIAAALRAAQGMDDHLPILVTGSFYAVSEAMAMLNHEAAR